MSKTCISPFLCFDSQTFYLLLGLTLVTCVYFYNNYRGRLVRDMNIDKIEFNTNNSLLGAPISDDPEVKATLESKDYQRAINPLLPRTDLSIW